jgi:hypothetical protein
MSNGGKPFTTVTLEDGSVAVVHSVPRAPSVLEVIAVFFEAARARDYADRENSRAAAPGAAPTEAPTQPRFAPTAPTPELNPRQSAVLSASRQDGSEQAGGSEGHRPRRSRERAARIIALYPAIPGKEGPHQNRPRRFRACSRLLPSAIGIAAVHISAT